MVGLVTLLAGWEFGQMMRAGNYATTPLFTLALIVLFLLDAFFPDLRLVKPGLTFIVVSALIWQLFQTATSAPTVDWALSLSGGLYIGLGAANLLALRLLDDGLAWAWLALLCTWGADTFAYLIGRAWGRRKFWPRHSPGKTWEGVAGGVLGSLVGAFIVVAFSGLSWIDALVVGLLVSLVAPLGDLVISMMKRHVGVKDTSHFLPGHGGMLDRIDALLAVSIFVHYYAIWFAN